MAKTDTKKTKSVQKTKNVKSVVAAKPHKALAAKAAKAPVKKAAPAKPAPAKPAPAKKPNVKAGSAPRPAVQPAAPRPVAPSTPKAPAKATASRRVRFSKTDLKQFQIELLALRDRITNQSGAMRSAALQQSDEVNVEEDGTDAFLRLQTLEQVGTQQGIITKIDEALHAISKGMYGVCDICGELINKERLAVLPFARNCIKCQSEMERPNRYGRYR